MRLSVLEGDPGWVDIEKTNREGTYIEVWLNGGILKECVTADEERGMAVIRQKSEDGELLFTKAPDGSKYLMYKRLMGRVEISTQ